MTWTPPTSCINCEKVQLKWTQLEHPLSATGGTLDTSKATTLTTGDDNAAALSGSDITNPTNHATSPGLGFDGLYKSAASDNALLQSGRPGKPQNHSSYASHQYY